MRTFLSANAYPWTCDEGFYFRGYFVVRDGCLRGHEAIKFLKERLAHNSDVQILPELNGVFSLIWERKEEILFAVDRLRGLPLFYAVVDGELWIGNDAASLSETLPQRTLDGVAAEEYLASEIFVSGSHTLLREVWQVQAAEICHFKKNAAEITKIPYFHMEHSNFFDDSDTAGMLQAFHDAYTCAGKNLVKALNGRTAVIPLSGGSDSRMVANLLKQEGYSKVICFTYGKEGNREAEISRKVAESLGFPWHMVPYTGKMWERLRNDPELAAYERLAFTLVSSPHIQDFPAVMHLKAQGVLPEDSVFVPGHSGDLIAGSHITEEFLVPVLHREDFLQTIKMKFYMKPLSVALSNRLEQRFPSLSSEDVEGMAAQSEWFNIQERQAKFIVNSVRAYEFFGYEWLIPLWDNSLFDFWKKVPIRWRYQRKLYFLAVNDELPSTNDITTVTRLANRIRRVSFLRVLLRRIKRIRGYWDSSLRTERLLPASAYLRAALLEPPTFSHQTFSSRKQLRQLKEQLCEK